MKPVARTTRDHDLRLRGPARRSPPDPRAVGLGFRRLGARLAGARLEWVALGMMLVLAAALLYRETRGTTLWFDEWTWVLDRRGSSLSSYLAPHSEHLSLIPVAIYKLLFATAGIGDYRPYRLILIACHVLVAALVFIYSARRVGGFLALVAAALIVFLGPAWQNFIWAFSITWLISLAAGIGALLAIDRGDRAGAFAGSALLAVSLASSGIGVPITIGLVVEALLRRRGRRDLWILGAPITLYALWWLGYQQAGIARHALVVAPGFVAGEMASVLAALAGLAGPVSPAQVGSSGTLLQWGPPLAVVAAIATAWRLIQVPALRPRVGTLLVVAGSFWILTALNRWFISEPFTSRYLYVGAVFVVLAAAELGRGVTLRGWQRPVIAIAAAGAVASNIGVLRDAARYMREQGAETSAALAAFDLTRGVVKPTFVESSFPGYPFIQISARQYFAAEQALGTPATPLAHLAGAPEPARVLADSDLTRVDNVALRAGPRTPALGARPAVEGASGGSVGGRGSCLAFAASSVSAAGAPAAHLAVTVPPGGVWISAGGGAAVVSARRFADEFAPVGTVSEGAGATLRPSPDRAPAAWHVQVVPVARTLVCGLPR